MVIELREDVGVKNIKELYSHLKELIKKESEIILDFSKVRRIDLSLAQLIMAANRESYKIGKKIILKSVSYDIKQQLYLSGFAKN
ncbi:MAG: STAS domain-containing protein [Spirochaetes bacterium]|nr:STAS domain-containing protein [Spirochaetota bacterium]